MIQPGEIYMASFGPAGPHPVIVVSREELNRGHYALAVVCTSARFATRSNLANCVPFQAGEFGFTFTVSLSVRTCFLLIKEQLDLTMGPMGRLDETAMQKIIASLMPEHARQTVRPDYLISGPGEYQIAELLSTLFQKPELLDNFPTQIDDFPPPALDLLRKNDYVIVLTSRGCPFRCTFCATYNVNTAFSQRQPASLVEEILCQTERFNVQDVAFYDDAFLLQADRRIKPILRALIDSQRPLRFHTPNGLHARYIDEELAQLMRRSNFRTIHLSLESVAKERLRDIHNKITPGEMARAVQHLVQAGYEPQELETYIIWGCPTNRWTK